MQRLHFVVLALGLALAAGAASCKKDTSSGLPPATDWGQRPSTPGPNGPGTPGPNANPHGPGVATGGSPHAGGDPHGGVVPQQTAGRTLEKLPDGRLALGPFTLAAPAGWTEKPVTSSMRAAHFVLSSAPGKEAELVIYYFGVDGAGSVEDNLDRWLDQFQQPGGKPSKGVAKIEQTKLGGQDATIVTVAGRYVTTTMPGGGDPIDKADQALIGAIVASPKGPYYWKLVGAKPTIDAEAGKVRAMLASLKLR